MPAYQPQLQSKAPISLQHCNRRPKPSPTVPVSIL